MAVQEWEQEAQAQRRSDLGRLEQRRERWRPEIEHMIRMRAATDLQWRMFDKSMDYMNTLEIERLRQKGRMELAGARGEEARKTRGAEEDIEQKQRKTYQDAIAPLLPGMPQGSLPSTTTETNTLISLDHLAIAGEAAAADTEKQAGFDKALKTAKDAAIAQFGEENKQLINSAEDHAQLLSTVNALQTPQDEYRKALTSAFKMTAATNEYGEARPIAERLKEAEELVKAQGIENPEEEKQREAQIERLKELARAGSKQSQRILKSLGIDFEQSEAKRGR